MIGESELWPASASDALTRVTPIKAIEININANKIFFIISVSKLVSDIMASRANVVIEFQITP